MCSIDPELAMALEKTEYWLWNDAVRTIWECDAEELIEREKKQEVMLKNCVESLVRSRYAK